MKNLQQLFISFVIFFVISDMLWGQNSMEYDSVYYIINTSQIKYRDDIYTLSSIRPVKTIADNLTFASSERTEKTFFGTDTVYIIHDSLIIYNNKLIPVGSSPVKLDKYYIANKYVSNQKITRLEKNRANAMYFFRMSQKLLEPSTISVFDPNKVVRGVQKKPYILNANIQTPMSLGGERWHVRNTGWYLSANLTPQFVVRIFQNDPSKGDYSRPVRTPSYMPAGTFFFTHNKLWDKNKNSGHYFGVRAFHHSDGQDSSIFNPDGSINVYNGDFGEDLAFEFIYNGYIRFGERTPYKGPKNKRPFRIYAERENYKFVSWHIGYEYHPESLTTLGLKDYDLYGRHRINIRGNLIKIASFNRYLFLPEEGLERMFESSDEEEKWRLSLNITYIADGTYNLGDERSQTQVKQGDLKNRMNIFLTTYRPFRGTPYTALFLQGGYYGSDPYNVYFQYRMWYIRGGIALHFFNF